MKIKLINPPTFHTDYTEYFWPQVTIATLSCFLRKNGYFVDQDDLNIKCNQNKINFSFFRNTNLIKKYLTNSKNLYLDYLLERIVNLTTYKSFDIIGISIQAYQQYFLSLAIAKKMKEKTDSLIIIGGAFISLLDDSTLNEILSKYPFIDYIGIGDGEFTLLKLIKHLEGKCGKKQVPGLVYRYKDRIKKNNKFNININEQCIPDFGGLPLNLYKSRPEIGLYYRISRGCDNKCTFCLEPNNKLQFKNINKIIKDLKFLVLKYGFKCVLFTDNACNLNYTHLEKLCDGLIRNKINITWRSEARADNLDKKLLIKMRKSGCTDLEFGIESGSNRILRIIRKNIDLGKVEEILKESANVGIKNHVNFILGYPGEEENDIKDTINFIKRNIKYIYSMKLIPFTLVYNSYIYNNPKEFSIFDLKRFTTSPIFFTFDDTKYNFEERNQAIKENKDKIKKLFQNKIIVRKEYVIF
jgi:radical SAM superfamily enzyme YgiQ (UPF0313 family)